MNSTDYTGIKHRNIDMLIADGVRDALDERRWHAVAEGLFAEARPDALVKQGAYKTILRADVGGRETLVKRYVAKGAVGMLKAVFSGTRARQEFLSSVHIHHAGIPTAKPLLLAERVALGCLPADSLVVLELLDGCCELRDVFFDDARCSPEERLQIAAQFGQLTGKIFTADVYQYDYSLNNFLFRKGNDGPEIYFIDFERVTVNRPLVREQKLQLLAKLNRVGREVSDTERLRFLESYLREDRGVAESAGQVSREVQQLTVAQLKSDIERGRITSLYTHGTYDRIKQESCGGLCLKGIDPGEVIKHIDGTEQLREIEVTGHAAPLQLTVVSMATGDALKFWSCLTALIITGLPAVLPHVLVTGERRGWVLFTLEGYAACRTALAADTPQVRFMERNLPEAVACVKEGVGEKV